MIAFGRHREYPLTDRPMRRPSPTAMIERFRQLTGV